MHANKVYDTFEWIETLSEHLTYCTIYVRYCCHKPRRPLPQCRCCAKCNRRRHNVCTVHYTSLFECIDILLLLLCYTFYTPLSILLHTRCISTVLLLGIALLHPCFENASNTVCNESFKYDPENAFGDDYSCLFIFDNHNGREPEHRR